MQQTLAQVIQELKESSEAHMRAIGELRQVMLERGIITKESLAMAESEVANG